MATPYVVNGCNDIPVAWFQCRRSIFAAGDTHPCVMEPLWHGFQAAEIFFFASAQFVVVTGNARMRTRFAFDKTQ
jgi:hypothetical protein